MHVIELLEGELNHGVIALDLVKKYMGCTCSLPNEFSH
jgi:hypothetical protein